MGGTTGSQRKATVRGWQCLAQDMSWGGQRYRCWRSSRSNNLLAWAKTLNGDVQALTTGNSLQLAFIAICDTI